MRFESCEASPAFYKVKGITKTIVNFLQYSVKPSLRYYEDGAWHVHISHAVDLTQLAYTTSGYVNYSALPDDVQMKIAQEKSGWVKGAGNSWKTVVKEAEITQAYNLLYLIPSAPGDVVKAVWKVLAKLHHPDRGGDEELFKKLKAAYEKIVETL